MSQDADKLLDALVEQTMAQVVGSPFIGNGFAIRIRLVEDTLECDIVDLMKPPQ